MSKPTNGENFTTELEDREIDLLEKYALRSRERRTQLGNNFRKYKPRAHWSTEQNIIAIVTGYCGRKLSRDCSIRHKFSPTMLKTTTREG